MKKNKEIVPELYRDINELYNSGQIKEAMRLTREYSETLGQPFYFAHNYFPHYPIRNYDAKTVFVHLNPGIDIGKVNSIEDFQKQKWNGCFMNNEVLKGINSAEELVEKYNYEWEWYARKRFGEKKQKDNFDFKQACFLKNWPDNGIDLQNGNVNDIQTVNTINVIDQKLQLELFPYGSNTISTNLLATIFKKNHELISPFIEKLFEIISLYPHKYVIFGSSIYHTLFLLYDNRVKKIIEFISPKQKFEGVTKNALYFTYIKLKWNDKIIDAGIAHSFPRRDLPNAYAKMEKYGELSAAYFLKSQKEHS